LLKSYYTILTDGQAEIEVKKSRFICSIKRINSEKEAQEFINLLKKEHWKANHNCYAYLIGENNEIERSSDDGEPSGTAGVPILEVLKKQELLNVCAVVTRYFGGTKLGTGGLIRAYSHAVSNATVKIGIVRATLEENVFVTIDYSSLGKLQYFLKQYNYTIKDSQFQEKVCLSVMTEDTDLFKAEVTDLLSGQVSFSLGEKSYTEKRILR